MYTEDQSKYSVLVAAGRAVRPTTRIWGAVAGKSCWFRGVGAAAAAAAAAAELVAAAVGAAGGAVVFRSGRKSSHCVQRLRSGTKPEPSTGCTRDTAAGQNGYADRR
jgi:hypothetical protein